MDKYIKAELHIHSYLSPCASMEMSPKNIIAKVKEKEIKLMVLCDHNSALNCPAMEALAKEAKIGFIAGIEITTQEEVHVVSLFRDTKTAVEFGNYIYQHLPEINNQPEKTGKQLQVNNKGDILAEVAKYLNSAIDISLAQLTSQVHHLKGLVIPAHIDRPSYGLMEVLGILPNLPFDALEISANFYKNNKCHDKKYQELLKNYFCYQSSDAHFLDDIGRNSIQLSTENEIYKLLASS